jgi:hypothetical protein
MRGNNHMNIEQSKPQIDWVWGFLSEIDMNRHEPPTIAEVIARRALQEKDRLGYLRNLAAPDQWGEPNLVAARRHAAKTLLARLRDGEQL